VHGSRHGGDQRRSGLGIASRSRRMGDRPLARRCTVSARERSPHDAALVYAEHGWHVFPCLPGEKVPVTTHGCKDASRDPDQIDKWWRRNPDRNVAVATGAPFGPSVLDVDQHGEAGSGFAALNQLKRSGLVPPAMATVRTPSGGIHLYFKGSAEGNGSLPKHHLDHRGVGGYVLAPGSRVGGRPYEVVTAQPSTATFDWQAARNHLQPPQARPQRRLEREDGEGDLERLTEWVSRQPHGNRNPGLHYAACRLAEKGLLTDDGIEALVSAALKSGLRGGEKEARKTIESALRPFSRQAEAGA
jgi:Bifunctional DNA primase/polymerase, N-terminal